MGIWVTRKMLCPKCHEDRAHRAHRRGLEERLAALFSKHPYRCHECGYRFLVYRYAEPEESLPLTAAEREIMSTRQSIRRKRARREFLLYSSALLLFLAFLYFITRERTPQSD
jgi:transposase-like protein